MHEKRENLTASIMIGSWTLVMETRRLRIRSERDVHLSDNPTGHGKGTLLRTEKRSCGMAIHEVRMKHLNGDTFLVRVTEQGKRTSVTVTRPRGLTDIDGKAIQDKPESYTLDKAAAYLGRVLGRLSPAVIRETVLTPLPEVEAEEIGDARGVGAATAKAAAKPELVEA